MMNLVVRCILAVAAVLFLSAFGGGCATVKTCTQPVTFQAATDGSAVLLCTVNTGQSLAACEEAQLSVEAGQVTADALVCAENAIATAAKGAHTTGAK